MKKCKLFAKVFLFMLCGLVGFTLSNAKSVKPRVFVNPGHGGHTSNDRPMPFMHFAPGDTAGYYESNSNMWKSFALINMLRNRGYEVYTSRVTNTEDDDLDLFEIVQLAANSGADVFMSIHSNATGVKRNVNYTVQLFRGHTDSCIDVQSKEFAQLITERLSTNTCTPWTHPKMTAGDWDFFSDWGYQVGLGVLRYNKIPGMLSEGSFHDYLPERQRLLNRDYCALEAFNFTIALEQYFGTKVKKPVGVVAGVLRHSNWLRPDTCQLFQVDSLESVNGARVDLLKGKKVVATCVTDTLHNGFYMFRDLKPGKYTLIVTPLDDNHGHLPVGQVVCKEEVIVKPEDITYVNFLLENL
ncbi:MAG: N-acetylmuramoyl-L-alanine amidase [Bacteroidales bacterium]|nr:N-acetylmuramoyl-L-alanine amidase [Bacteroidales bacterium]